MQPRITWNRLYVAVGAALAIVALFAVVAERVERARPGTPAYERALTRSRLLIADWAQETRVLAGLMLERYGPPESASTSALTWGRRRPLKRVVVRRAPADAALETVVDYYVSPERVQDVRGLGHGIALSTTRGELSAASGREELNFLALNLADELARGKVSPEEARRTYEAVAEISSAGKSSPYLRGLAFEPHWPRPPVGDGPGAWY